MSITKKVSPSMDQWLKEAKLDPLALEDGMFLVHNGVVRRTSKAQVRQGINDGSEVKEMVFSYSQEQVDEVIDESYKMNGINLIRVWLNEGVLDVGDDIMYILVGGDIRPHVIDALQYLVGRIKNECVKETERT